jgi:hypothetical protein
MVMDWLADAHQPDWVVVEEEEEYDAIILQELAVQPLAVKMLKKAMALSPIKTITSVDFRIHLIEAVHIGVDMPMMVGAVSLIH